MDRWSRRQFVQGVSVAGLGLLAGCGRLSFWSPPPPVARVPRIGFLVQPSAQNAEPFANAFRQGLHDYGWVEGENLLIAWRYADGDVARLPPLARELIALPVEVVVAFSVATPVARRVTDTVPIVMVGTVDAVTMGLVASLARPGGNVTGVSILERELTAKRLELLHETVPSMTRMAVLWSGTNEVVRLAFEDALAAAAALHLDVQSVGVHTADELESRFEAATGGTTDGLLMIADSQMQVPPGRVGAFALRRGLPTMLPGRGGISQGGLMTYSANASTAFRRAAYYVD